MIEKKHNNLALLLGTGPTSLPILNALKSFGFLVGVIGNRPLDICHKFADFSYFIDYTDYESVLKIYQKYNYKYVVPSCSDISYEVAAKLSKNAGAPGFDDEQIIRIITNKYAFRDHLKKSNLNYPKYFHPEENPNEELNNLSLPIIVKPLEADTGKGIKVVTKKNKLLEAINYAKSVSRDDKCLVEEFKPGTLHSISCFIKNYAICKSFIVDEYCSDYPFAVNESNYPSKLSDEAVNMAASEVQTLVASLELVDGLLHVQFIFYNDTVYLIESMRRMPGDYFAKLIELSNEYPYYQKYVSSFIKCRRINKTCDNKKNEKLIARQTITSHSARVMQAISFNCSGKLLEYIPLAKNGEDLNQFPADKQGVAFFEYSDHNSLESEMGSLVNNNFAI